MLKIGEVMDINHAASVLIWDQSTYMPSGGVAARGRQLATLRRIAHQRFTDSSIGKLLDELDHMGAELDYHSDEAAMLRVTRRHYEKAIRIPAEFTSELAEHSATAYSAWSEARPAGDFAKVAPLLEKTLELSRTYSDYFPGYAHPADPHIDQSDSGMTVETLRPIFDELRAETVPLVAAISEQPQVDNRCLTQFFPEDDQWRFGMMVAERFGYDITRGRQDKTLHPFAIKFSIGDVRITTRFQDNRLDDGLFSTMHETGHALYEQGVLADYEGTHLNRGTSAGVHESQSRLWENLVGRSRRFWEHFYPEIQKTFPSQLGDVSLDAFYRAVNRVEPSLIRTDADEVTYNLHVIIRFDLELALLEGTLSIADLPDAWHARYESDLGCRAPNDTDGVLQDVHWFAGLIGGAFQGYTIGNILASQFYAKAIAAAPHIDDEFSQGQFESLHTWLRENIYQYGSKYKAMELIERVTGEGISLSPYISYLNEKYADIYGLG